MDDSDFLPDVFTEKHVQRTIGLTDRELKLFSMFAKEKGWKVAKTMRVCTKAVILLEYKKANSLEEALRKSSLLEVDRRRK